MLHLPYPDVLAGPPRPSRIIRPGGGTLAAGVERHVGAGAGAILLEHRSRRHDHDSQQRGRPGLRTRGGRTRRARRSGILGVASQQQCRRPEGAARCRATRACAASAEARAARHRPRGRTGAAHLWRRHAGRHARELHRHARRQPDRRRARRPDGGRRPRHGDAAGGDAAAQAHPRRTCKSDLPEPLADPVLDLRIKSATAQSYFVKAGDFIQIIDVDGRQCTDFQCFSARKLDKGKDHPLDVTTTRTLMGASYPMPGLHSKYYDHDMEPLVEVVQDTCRAPRRLRARLRREILRRHRLSRPCQLLRQFQRRAGRAWRDAARRLDGDQLLLQHRHRRAWRSSISDEPWSRPGDYVLLRALTDLVCVSSACPDDTTPANGWNLTDIHVRIYSGAEKFSRAVATRTTPDAEPKMTRETAFHSSFAKHTRNFVEYKGYWLANCFAKAGPIEEYWACREKAVVHGPLAAAQVRGHRPGRRGAAAICPDARRQEARPSARSSIRPCATSMAA